MPAFQLPETNLDRLYRFHGQSIEFARAWREIGSVKYCHESLGRAARIRREIVAEIAAQKAWLVELDMHLAELAIEFEPDYLEIDLSKGV